VNAESPTPGRSLPSKQELLDFQSTWLKRAGAGAVGGALIVAAAIVLQRVGLHLPDSDSDADQLVFAHAHDGRLVWTSFLQGIGFVLFAVPLVFLFRSAAGRAARVRNAFLGVIVLGPLAFGLGVAITSIGTSDAASKFVDQEPAKVQQARQQAEQAQSAPANGKGTSGGATTTTTAKSTTAETTTATGSTTTATGTTTTAVAKPKTPDQAASDAREDLADHLNRHTTVLIVGGLISTIGVLALVFGMIYTNLWSMRVGLVSRFWGALGMAFGLFLIIPLFPPVPGLVLWFAAIGLMFLGVWPRPLPPAWGAGEAIPWAKPGDSIGPPPVEAGPPGTVEGSGREVAEKPLPEEEPGNGEPPEPPYGETQGQRRKKRKRRS
jgi:hypothetical protein